MEIINQKSFTCTVQIGSRTFESSGNIYRTDHQLSLSLPCKGGNPQLCAPDTIEGVNVAAFTLDFKELDVQLEGVAGQFDYVIYNRHTVRVNSLLTYTRDRITMVSDSAETCNVSPVGNVIYVSGYLDDYKFMQSVTPFYRLGIEPSSKYPLYISTFNYPFPGMAASDDLKRVI